MIRKLKKVGFTGPLLDWFTSYLAGREHCVRINEIVSAKLETKHGVPQGSVLGPLLFLIYINELFFLPLKGKIIGYADDTSLLYSAATAEQINEDFEHDVKIITKWFRENFLILNINKCQYNLFLYEDQVGE